MKKVLLVISLLLVLNVKAEGNVSEEEFTKMMKANGYSVGAVENGYSASKDGENYLYNIYDSNESAIEGFSQYTSLVADESSNANRIAEYNLDNAIADNRNMIAYDLCDDETSRCVYYYVYRVDSSVIYGYGNSSKKNEIEITVEKIVNNEFEVASNEKETTDSQKENNKNSDLIISVIVVVIVLLLLIPICVKISKNLKNAKSKK